MTFDKMDKECYSCSMKKEKMDEKEMSEKVSKLLGSTYVEEAIHMMSANMSRCIKSLKKERNISSREISRRTGISIAVISDMEGNKYLPKMEVLIKLAKGMEFDITELLQTLWSADDNASWCRLTEIKCSSPFFSKPCKTNTLEDMLQREGLTKNDVKEVLEFIAFKKSRQKRR